MKDEYFNSKEFKEFNDYKEFAPFKSEEYKSPGEESKNGPEFTLKDEENEQIPKKEEATEKKNQEQSKKKRKKAEQDDARKMMNKLSESSGQVVAKVTAGASAAVVGTVAAATVLTPMIAPTPDFNINEIYTGEDYAYYSVFCEDFDENFDYFIEVANSKQNYSFPLKEGNNENIVSGLLPGYEYTVTIVGKSDGNIRIEYEKQKVFTLKENLPKVDFAFQESVNENDRLDIDYKINIDDKKKKFDSYTLHIIQNDILLDAKRGDGNTIEGKLIEPENGDIEFALFGVVGEGEKLVSLSSQTYEMENQTPKFVIPENYGAHFNKLPSEHIEFSYKDGGYVLFIPTDFENRSGLDFLYRITAYTDDGYKSVYEGKDREAILHIDKGINEVKIKYEEIGHFKGEEKIYGTYENETPVILIPDVFEANMDMPSASDVELVYGQNNTCTVVIPTNFENISGRDFLYRITLFNGDGLEVVHEGCDKVAKILIDQNVMSFKIRYEKIGRFGEREIVYDSYETPDERAVVPQSYGARFDKVPNSGISIKYEPDGSCALVIPTHFESIKQGNFYYRVTAYNDAGYSAIYEGTDTEAAIFIDKGVTEVKIKYEELGSFGGVEKVYSTTENEGVVNLVPQSFDATMQTPDANAVEVKYLQNNTCVLYIPVNFENTTAKDYSYRITLFNSYGFEKVIESKEAMPEIIINDDVGMLSIKYEKIGHFAGQEIIFETVTAQGEINIVPQSYLATFDRVGCNDIEVSYGPDYVCLITINTNFKNTTNHDFYYRITAYDGLGFERVYEGKDAVATINLGTTLDKVQIRYEEVGRFNGEEKVYGIYENDGFVNLVPKTFDATMQTPEASQAEIVYGADNICTVHVNTNFQNDTNMNLYYRVTLFNANGLNEVVTGIDPIAEFMIGQDVGAFKIRYEKIGKFADKEVIFETVETTDEKIVVPQVYGASFIKAPNSDVHIHYGEDGSYTLNFLTNFENRTNHNFYYRITAFTDSGYSKVYEGVEREALIVIDANIEAVKIKYEELGKFGGVEKVYSTSENTGVINLIPQTFDATMVMPNSDGVTLLYGEDGTCKVQIPVNFENLTSKNYSYRITLHNASGLNKVYEGKANMAEIIVSQDVGTFKIKYEKLGHFAGKEIVYETYDATGDVVVVPQVYGATLDIVENSNIGVSYGQDGRCTLTVKTNFKNTTNHDFYYRVTAFNDTGYSKIYEGKDAVATLLLDLNVENVKIRYEKLGRFGGVEKLYDAIENVGIINLVPERFEAAMQTPDASGVQSNCGQNDCTVTIPVNFENTTGKNFSYRITLFSDLGFNQVFEGKDKIATITVPKNAGALKIKYEKLGHFAGKEIVYETHTTQDLLLIAPDNYGASFDKVAADRVTVLWDQNGVHKLTVPVGFTNNSQDRFIYRVTAYNDSGYSKVYEGSDREATLDIDLTVPSLKLRYEELIIIDGHDKIYGTYDAPGEVILEAPKITMENQYSHDGNGNILVPYVMTSRNGKNEVYERLEFAITANDGTVLSTEEWDIGLDSKKAIMIEMPLGKTSFTVQPKLTYQAAYGGNTRVVTGEAKQFNLVNELKLLKTDVNTTDGTATLRFAYYGEEGSKVVVTDKSTGEIFDVSYGSAYINSLTADRTLTYYSANAQGVATSQESTVILKANMRANYTFNYKNPNEVLKTFNSDGTYNLYFDVNYTSQDPDLFYEIVLTEGMMEESYKFTSNVATIENVRGSKGLIYRVVKVIDGVNYLFKDVSVSGTTESPNPEYKVENVTYPSGKVNIVMSSYYEYDKTAFKLKLDDGSVISLTEQDLNIANGQITIDYTLPQGTTTAEFTFSVCEDMNLYNTVSQKTTVKGSAYETFTIPMVPTV